MEKEPFISLVLPESVLGDNRLTYFERILLIDMCHYVRKMAIVGLLIGILWRNLIVPNQLYQKV